MAIDNYNHTFKHLVETSIPEYYKNLQSHIKEPISLSEFSIKGVGVVGLTKRLNLVSDFQGCYVLIEKTKPIYVGISRSVLQRLQQHVKGTTHFDASLAYRIAYKNMPHNHTRSMAMKNDVFKDHFDKAKSYIRNLNVAFVEIDNPIELYVFEPFCSMELNTSEWNTFETH